MVVYHVQILNPSCEQFKYYFNLWTTISSYFQDNCTYMCSTFLLRLFSEILLSGKYVARSLNHLYIFSSQILHVL